MCDFKFWVLLGITCFISSCIKKNDVLVSVKETKTGQLTKLYLNNNSELFEGKSDSQYYLKKITFFKPRIETNKDTLTAGEKYSVMLTSIELYKEYGDSIMYKFGGQEVKSANDTAQFSFNVSEALGEKQWQGSVEVFDSLHKKKFEVTYYQKYWVR